ncbi:MAG: coproporphyrinogen III oxidase, partial [Chloroflexus aggregans]
MRHLYIHIPFCHRRCSYCDFNTYANMEHRIAAYVDALCTELAMLRESLPPLPKSPAAAALRPSIFFGGGTPSMLTPAQIERILTAATALVPLETAEISLEANPGTVLGREYLRAIRSLGVNRLSMGVQSLHDPTLRVLGRIHTAAEAKASYLDARAVGFESINLDFIFGLPGQDLADWQATLTEVISWDVDHLALYSLILEENTPL